LSKRIKSYYSSFLTRNLQLMKWHFIHFIDQPTAIYIHSLFQ